MIIRNDKNIYYTCILIYGKEYKLSQYANEVSVTFDGSPTSMNGPRPILFCKIIESKN